MDFQETEGRLSDITKVRDRESEYFTVTFCGVFSSGKSSILNYLLDYEGFSLPVGIFPITKMVTRIQYGTRLCFYLHMKNGGSTEISRDEFTQLVVGKQTPPEAYNAIEIEMPAEILKLGVVFLDTPGFLDEMGGELEKISREAVLNSGLVVFCTNAAQFGNQFEKEYIEELEQSIGNYCMVVNHMDCCNTQEDAEAVRDTAKSLIEGKGGRILNNRIGIKNCFFTVAAGMHTAMSGFGVYLRYILGKRQLKDELQQSSADNIRQYRRKRLSEDIALELEQLQETAAELNKKHEKLMAAAALEQKFKQAQFEQIKQEKIRIFESEIEYESEQAQKELKRLRDTGNAPEFVKNAKEYLHGRFTEIAKRADREMYNKNAPEELFLEYNKAVWNLQIPAPKMKAVKNRGILGRTLFTAINLAFLDFEIDDGYDYVYEEYHLPAIDAVRTKLKPALVSELRKKANRYYTASDGKLSSGLEQDINAQKELIQKWEKLLRKCNT